MSLRVLVVDDEPLSRKVVTMLLEKLGAAGVVIATSYAEAVAQLNGDPLIRMVITDHYMPDGSGVELLGAIRQDRFAVPHDVFVVIATSSDSFRLKAVSMALDVDAFLTKPFTMEQLAVNMVEFLTAKEPRKLKPVSYYQNQDVGAMTAAAELDA